MELLHAIEQLALVRLLKSSFIAYPIVNALHSAAIGTLFGSVLLMDLSVLGVVRSIPSERLVALLRRVAFGAFAVAVLTGFTLFSIQARHYAENPAFLLKLALIALALLNFVVFTTLTRRSPAAGTSPAIRISAIISLLTWSGVLLAGRFIGFI